MGLTLLRRSGAAALLWAAAAAEASSSSSSSSSSAPPSSSSTPDSVYADGGFDALSPLNRVAMLATIAVFLLLSVLSGRELWLLRYGRSAASSSPPPSSAAATNAKHHPTPKHHSYGGIPTPQSATAGPAAVPSASSASAPPSGGDVSTGAEMRERLFVLLFAACSIRVAALVVELTTLRAMETSPAASLYARLLSMFLWLPALLFVSMYGLVLLFWAQLCYACWGKFHPWPRRLFFAFNVLLYVAFVVLLFATATSGAFWRACDLLLGSVYLVGFCGMLYYSARLIQFFRRQGPDEDFFFDLPRASRASPRQLVLHRITAVCVLLSVLFVVKASYMIGLGAGFVPSEETQYRSPVGVHHVAFEFAMHFFTEFVPCSLLLIVTRKKATGAAADVAAAAAGNTTPGLLLPQHLSGLTPGSGTAAPHYGLRGRNNSAFNDDNHSVGSGSLTGYQFQAVQRSYGSTLTTALRSTAPTGGANSGSNPYQSMENGAATSTTAAHTPSYV